MIKWQNDRQERGCVSINWSQRPMDRTAEADTEEGMSDSRDAGSTAKIPKQNVETVSDFVFFSSKINVDGDCSHEIKIHCLKKNKNKIHCLEEKLCQT